MRGNAAFTFYRSSNFTPDLVLLLEHFYRPIFMAALRFIARAFQLIRADYVIYAMPKLSLGDTA